MADRSTAVRSRRRGRELEHALYDAALAGPAAVGYAGLIMEGIAARARTGKAALYRRWRNKHDLVRAALRYSLPAVPEPRADRSARENLLAVFNAHCDVPAGKTAFPSLAIMAQLIHEPELRAIFADASTHPHRRHGDPASCAFRPGPYPARHAASFGGSCLKRQHREHCAPIRYVHGKADR